MKKLIALSMLLVSSMSFANFVGPNTQITSVSNALKAYDDAWVSVEGTILERVGNENYRFTDGKNEIFVEIDNDVWLGQKADAKSKVRIHGEVELEGNYRTIDVKRIEVSGQINTMGGFK